ncbi:MAG: D-alanyl-D-alanine carboxypeptidase/D-alanyl-D-alanine endopeptidase, partial [Nocardioidaceae bacterium]
MRWGDESHRHGEAGSLMHRIGILVVVLLLAAGGATYAGWIPTIGDQASDPPSELAEPPAIVPGIELAEPAAAGPVLEATSGRPALPARIEQAVEGALSDNSLGRSVGFVAQDLGDPATAWRTGASVVTPASTLKLLTVATVLKVLGPDHRFHTSVVAGRTRQEIVLVGGGDPLLTDKMPDDSVHPTPATLAELARSTTRELGLQGVRRVRLAYDTSLFSGPAVNPAWEADYVTDDVVSPIVPLWVDEGREIAGYAARVPDPALVAAQRFAALLAERGVRVQGAPVQKPAPRGARELAAVESPPLVEIVQHVLEVSDNEAAEVLLRQAAIASGRAGSSLAGVQTVRATLAGLGIRLQGARLYDGSGLARGNRLPIQALVDVLALAADPEHHELNAVLTTLPVAGFTGSLTYRFVVVAQDGLGRVRAKTGTLTGVHGLAGLAVTADGRPLV